MLGFFLFALVGYFLGSFPSGFIAGRLVGVDVRQAGSGNIGATNVTRLLGKRFGYPVFALDFAKGAIAVTLSMFLAKNNGAGESFVELSGAVAGIFSVVGHSYPIWLRFKGGKGVATSIGVLFGLCWPAMIVVGVVWYLTFQLTRYVSLASIAAALALPAAIAAMLFFGRLNTPVLLYFSFCLTALVIFRHRSNLSRLVSGTEPRVLRK
jgi:acyl phosphate:glycerol-3-phosphate acyltransferase